MKKQIFATLLAVSIATLTTGCMKVNLDLTVSSDDTVSGSMILAFSNEALDLANSMGGSESLNTDSLIEEQDGVTVTEYSDDKYTGSKITFEKKPFAQFETGSSLDSLQFKREGNIVSVTGAIDMSGGDTASIDSLASNPLTSGLFSTSDISFSITMPGKIISNTGKIEGNKVTYSGKLGDDIVIDVKADTTAGPDLMTIAGGAGIALLALGGAAFAVIAMRKRKVTPNVGPTNPVDDPWA